jgi:hypothetical protein
MMLARDQYGQTISIPGKYPRKELLDYFGRKHASKMYVDKKDGKTVHRGYVIAGYWLSLWAPVEWEA